MIISQVNQEIIAGRVVLGKDRGWGVSLTALWLRLERLGDGLGLEEHDVPGGEIGASPINHRHESHHGGHVVRHARERDVQVVLGLPPDTHGLQQHPVAAASQRLVQLGHVLRGHPEQDKELHDPSHGSTVDYLEVNMNF